MLRRSKSVISYSTNTDTSSCFRTFKNSSILNNDCSLNGNNQEFENNNKKLSVPLNLEDLKKNSKIIRSKCLSSLWNRY
jgi:hypothetical protein